MKSRTAAVNRRMVAACAWLALVAALGFPLRAQRSPDYEAKAAFIYNIVTFTEWPDGALGAAGEPFQICVFGRDPFGPSLEGAVHDHVVAGHSIAIERITAGSSVPRCHVLFVPQSESARTTAALRAAADGHVLTIGETPRFLDQGGMINLAVEGGRVRFDVNTATALARGLRISSKLLRIARSPSNGARDRDR